MSPICKPWDLFQLGEHRIICGDATDTKCVEALLEEETIDLLLTDVPYGVDLVSSKKGFSQSKQEHMDIVGDHLQSDEEFTRFTESWLWPITDTLSDYNSYYIFNSDRMMFPMREALVKNGFKLSQLLVWVKTWAVIGRLDYLPQHELIAYGWRWRHTFHKSKDKSVIICPKPLKNSSHPTMKPIRLLRQLILNSSKTRDTVYDPFWGSGSTLLACEQTLRRCRMVEIEPKYCEVTIKRWEKLTGKSAVKVTT